jgi:rare lipoprotein A
MSFRASQSPQTGKASYYANKFHGRLTANGERYNKNEFTCAHRTLPFGTWIKVTNLKNNKTVMVRVNDRGPYAKDRLIDLSRAAAESVDMVKYGIVSVSIEIMLDYNENITEPKQQTDSLSEEINIPATDSVLHQLIEEMETIKD